MDLLNSNTDLSYSGFINKLERKSNATGNNLDGIWINLSAPNDYVHSIQNGLVSEIKSNVYKDLPIIFRGDGKFLFNFNNVVYTGSLNQEGNIIEWVDNVSGSKTKYVQIANNYSSPNLTGNWIAPYGDTLKQVVISNDTIRGFDNVESKIYFTNPKTFSTAFLSGLYKGVLDDTNNIITWSAVENPDTKVNWYRTVVNQQSTPTVSQPNTTIPTDSKGGTSALSIFKANKNIQVFNDALDFYLEGEREKREGISSTGKINWINQNITPQSLANVYTNFYMIGYKINPTSFSFPQDVFENLKDFYNEGHREQKEGIDPFGKINYIANNFEDSYNSNLYAIYYLLGRKDELEGKNRVLNNTVEVALPEVVTRPISSGQIMTTMTTPVTRPVGSPLPKSKPISQDDEDIDDMGDSDMGDENLRTDEEDGKILGMPKGVAIGLGVGVLVIGGLLIFKRK